MTDGEEYLTAALPAFEISGQTDGAEELPASHEMENTRRTSRSLSMQNEDSLASDSVRFNALIDLLATDGRPNSRDQYQGESTAEVVYPGFLQTSPPGLPLLTRHYDPFQTPERRPHLPLPVQLSSDSMYSVPPVFPHGRLPSTVSPLLLSPTTPNKEEERTPRNSLWQSQRSSPTQVIRGLAARPPPVDLTDAPSTQSFTEQHGIVHSTPALNPTSEQPITTPSGERQTHWAPQEQLDVMARSLINAKAESEAPKRKCAKLQQTMNQLRGQSSLQPAEEGELARSASRSHQKGHSKFMDAEPGLYALPSGSNEASRNLTLLPNQTNQYASGDHPRLSTRSPDEIERALAMVERIDELVYKRKALSRAPASAQQIFSDENVEGLFRRIEIWERAARSPAPPR